jgi:arylformamidase
MFIYKQYDQAALNVQFNNRLRAPDYAERFKRCEEWSRQTENKYPLVKNIIYGSHPRERLDIYPALQPHSKTLVFIHGGYWKAAEKESFYFIADGFQSYSITTVLIEYPLMPDVSMDQLVSSCRTAVNWVRQNIASYNGDPEQIYIAGHSAGGHLAAMLMTDRENKSDAFKGVCALSGLFNLIPVQLSELNDDLEMDATTAVRNSPVHLDPVVICPLLLAVGADESDEFKDQSKELYNSWNKQISIQLIEPAGLNHFSILEAIADKKDDLHKALCRMMGV